MNCKPGDLARIVRPFNGPKLLDLYVSVVRQSAPGEIAIAKSGLPSEHKPARFVGWLCDANHPSFPRLIADICLHPIRNDPGNEHFVVEARKSLPRPATAKGDTITERGELV